jgi:Uma2 family endonuclease
MTVITLNLNPVVKLDSEQFFRLCQENPALKLERTAQGELVVMPPTGGETGRQNAQLTAQLVLWNDRINLGEAFDSSTGFKLPNGADRSPDAAWVERSRWQSLTLAQREKFLPLCPDFVIELLSPTDTLQHIQAKMQEYLENGCRLGWLIARQRRVVEIYRCGHNIEILSAPESLSGEDILPGFTLNLKKLWS